jgi:phosphoglycerol geranylgeranyltransferase
MSAIYNRIINSQNAIAILIDPDKFLQQNTIDFFRKLNLAQPDFIFIGGSTVSKTDFDSCIVELKKNTESPLIIFPGGSHQIHEAADSILFLSLLSGRNPDYLIGHHIAAADEISKMKIEVIPTSYLLIDGGKKSSVEFVSQTTPLPHDQDSLARKIALAGMLQGKKITYLDAGSGAINTVSQSMIRQVKTIGLPLIIGGGIRSVEQVKTIHEAGANIVVIGNRIEDDIEFLLDIANYQKNKNEMA